MYSKRSYDEIVNFLLARLSEETDVSVFTPGGVARTLMEVVSKELSTDFNIFDFNLSQVFISTATGRALDNFGTLFGVTRKAVDPTINSSSKAVYFYLNGDPNHTRGIPNKQATELITIPAGTYVSTDEISAYGNPILWQTVSDAEIAVGDYLAYVSIQPVIGTTFPVGTGKLLNHSIDNSELYVYNKEDISGTASLESDTNYRFRIINGLRLLATGNYIALQIAALGVSGVKSVIIDPLYYGVGTVRVMVVPEVAGTNNVLNITNAVTDLINQFKSAGDICYVVTPSPIRLDIRAELILDNSVRDEYTRSMILMNAERDLRKYINSLSVNQGTTVSALITEVVQSNPMIKDCIISSNGGIIVNNEAHDFSRISAGEDEQIYAGDLILT